MSQTDRADSLLLRAQDGTVYPLTETTLIGREADCQIMLSGPRISRHHARIVRRDGQLLVEDLHSGSGTFVNGRRVQGAQALHTGDELRLDDFALRLVAGDAAEITALPVPDRGAGAAAQNLAVTPIRTDTTYLLRSDELALMNALTRKDIEYVRPGAGEGAGLVVLSAPIRGKIMPLRAATANATWLVGRDPEADVHLIDRAVAHHHAHIHRLGERWSIENLGSANPLFVNGVSVTNCPLDDGDRIQLGRSELQFHTDCSRLAIHLPEREPKPAGRYFLIGALAVLVVSLVGLAALALGLFR